MSGWVSIKWVVGDWAGGDSLLVLSCMCVCVCVCVCARNTRLRMGPLQQIRLRHCDKRIRLAQGVHKNMWAPREASEALPTGRAGVEGVEESGFRSR